MPYLSPVSQLSTAVQRTEGHPSQFFAKSANEKERDIQLKDGLEILD